MFPVGKGVFAFCWVVDHTGRGEAYVRGKGMMPVDGIAVACAKWFGKEAPTAADLANPEVLVETFWESYNPRNVRPLIGTASKPPPKSFKPIGKVVNGSLSPETLNGRGGGGWEMIAHWSRNQWKYEQDPAKYLAEWKAEDERIARDDAAEKPKPKAKTLAALARDKGQLSELVGLMHKRRVDILTAHLLDLARALKKLDARKDKLAAIEATVEKINAWNDKAAAIDTPEREILIDAIDAIARAAGMRGKDIAGPFRDW